jgi:DNA end-binding protein Ku
MSCYYIIFISITEVKQMEIHSSWKGFVQLSLVTIPVKIITAHESGREVQMHQLHKDCNQRINYQKICKVHGEVHQNEIIHGYEYAKDSYVIIDDAEIAKLRSQNDHTLHISGFVPSDSIDWLYYEGAHYYLVPDGKIGQKPYALLRESMVDNNCFAIARIILSTRDHLVMLRPHHKLIAMSVLYHEDQLKAESELATLVEDVALAPEEKNLTQALVGATSIKQFDMAGFKDEYRENILKLIDLKIAGKEVVASQKNEEPAILDLMEALKKSVEQAAKEQSLTA